VDSASFLALTDHNAAKKYVDDSHSFGALSFENDCCSSPSLGKRFRSEEARRLTRSNSMKVSLCSYGDERRSLSTCVLPSTAMPVGFLFTMGNNFLNNMEVTLDRLSDSMVKDKGPICRQNNIGRRNRPKAAKCDNESDSCSASPLSPIPSLHHKIITTFLHHHTFQIGSH
jgi:hypothetical protein